MFDFSLAAKLATITSTFTKTIEDLNKLIHSSHEKIEEINGKIHDLNNEKGEVVVVKEQATKFKHNLENLLK